MVEWIALVVSIFGVTLTIVLEREKLSRLFTDVSAWRSQDRQKREAEKFIKNISKSSEDKDSNNGFVVVFIILFFLFVISSGLSGLLKVKTIEEAGAVGTIVLSPALWFALRGLVCAAFKKQLEWFFTFFLIINYPLTFAGLGLLWGMITMGFVYLFSNLSVFWAGVIANICVLIIIWLIVFTNRRKPEYTELFD